MSYTRSFLRKPCSRTVFFSSVKDRPGEGGGWTHPPPPLDPPPPRPTHPPTHPLKKALVGARAPAHNPHHNPHPYSPPYVGTTIFSYADALRGIAPRGGRPAVASGPTRKFLLQHKLPLITLHDPLPATPDGTHAMQGNGDTIHTPQTQGGGAHDALATRRTERGNGQAEGCYVPLSGK